MGRTRPIWTPTPLKRPAQPPFNRLRNSPAIPVVRCGTLQRLNDLGQPACEGAEGVAEGYVFPLGEQLPGRLAVPFHELTESMSGKALPRRPRSGDRPAAGPLSRDRHHDPRQPPAAPGLTEPRVARRATERTGGL